MKASFTTALKNMKIWQKTALVITLPLALEVFVIAGTSRAQQDLDKAYRAERECNQVAILTYKCLKSSLDAMRELAYFGSTGRAKVRVRFSDSLERLQKLRDDLAQYPNSSAHRLDPFISELKEEILRREADQSDMSFAKTINSVNYASRLAISISRISDTMLMEQERTHEQTLLQLEERKADLNRTMVVGLLSSVLFCALLAFLYNRDALSQLKILMTNADRFGRGLSLLPQLKGTGELAQLDGLFHSMAQAINSLSERERAIFRNSADLIFVVNSKMKLVFLSDACQRMLGRNPDDLLGSQAVDLSRDLPEKLAISKQQSDLRFETCLSSSTPTLVDVEISAHWSENDQSFYCVAHDISTRKELERMKQSFLAMVTHDLRSPLTANLVGLDMLSFDTSLNESSQRVVARMKSSNERLIKMINNLLDMERLNSGSLEIELELVTFNDLVAETRVLLDPLLAEKKIELHADDSDSFIYCDSARLVQVATNILSNAIKFSTAGQSIELTFTSSPTRSIISVKDHGPGIAADFIPHLFDQFTQTGDKASQLKGSGLGLAISKKLVDLHHGEIEVVTELGKGTQFDIKLPLPPSAS